MANPVGVLFRINPTNGTLQAITDSSALNSSGDMTLVVTGAPAVSPDQVATLVYANGAQPLPWKNPTARFQIAYASIANPPGGVKVTATTY